MLRGAQVCALAGWTALSNRRLLALLSVHAHTLIEGAVGVRGEDGAGQEIDLSTRPLS